MLYTFEEKKLMHKTQGTYLITQHIFYRNYLYYVKNYLGFRCKHIIHYFTINFFLFYSRITFKIELNVHKYLYIKVIGKHLK